MHFGVLRLPPPTLNEAPGQLLITEFIKEVSPFCLTRATTGLKALLANKNTHSPRGLP